MDCLRTPNCIHRACFCARRSARHGATAAHHHSPVISGVERQQHAFSRVPCVTTVAAGQKRNVTRYVIRHALVGGGGGAEVGASITPVGGGGSCVHLGTRGVGCVLTVAWAGAVLTAQDKLCIPWWFEIWVGVSLFYLFTYFKPQLRLSLGCSVGDSEK